jgi:hypothetical protein
MKYTTDDLRVTRRARLIPYQPISFPIKRKGDFERWCDRESDTYGNGDLEAGTWGPKPDLVTETLVYASAYDLGGRCEDAYFPPVVYVRRPGDPVEGKGIPIEVGSIDECEDGTFITYEETTLPWDEYEAECDRRHEVAYGKDRLAQLTSA